MLPSFKMPQYDHRSLHEKHSDQKFPAIAKQNPNTMRFNETAYILGSARDSDDAYKMNAFNQVESDKLPSNRKVPDTRHSRYLGCLWELSWRLTNGRNFALDFLDFEKSYSTRGVDFTVEQ